ADVEGVGVEAPVPADDVEGVGGHRVHGAGDAPFAAAAVLDVDLDVALLTQQRLGRAVQVALAVGGVLEELAVARQVALGRGDVAVGLDGVQAGALALADDPAVDGRAG